MKTTTVRELRNNFKQVAAWVAAGEEVDITSRGKSMGKLVPNKPDEPWTPPSAASLAARAKAIWSEEERSEEDFQRMMDYIRAEREF